MTELALIYLIFISMCSIIVTVADKLLAMGHSSSRVSERSLIVLGFLGGSFFMYLTMRIISHKTRHKKFMVGLPVIFLVQIAIALFLVFYIN